MAHSGSPCLMLLCIDAAVSSRDAANTTWSPATWRKVPESNRLSLAALPAFQAGSCHSDTFHSPESGNRTHLTLYIRQLPQPVGLLRIHRALDGS